MYDFNDSRHQPGDKDLFEKADVRISWNECLEGAFSHMNRRTFLRGSAATGLLPLNSRQLLAKRAMRRVRPYDPDWPSKEAWKRLNDAVDGNLIPISFPLDPCFSSTAVGDCKTLFADLRNPYFIGDNPGVTQTLGWVDAWTTRPSVYAVAARNAGDIAAAVDFARN